MSTILRFCYSPNGLVGLSLGIIIAIYFLNNPLKHGAPFMIRRFVNWFPLGMTYAFLYMGRYNLTVAKNAMGKLMSIEDFGRIFAIGTAVYAVSFLINGPFIDKIIGGKKGILVAALGSSIANAGLGILTYGILVKHWTVNLVMSFSILYALNMYFQSYGAVSIIKVKAYWFHVRERGVFGAIFGALISIGVYFAFDWGQVLVQWTAADSRQTGTMHALARHLFAPEAKNVNATWALFFVPAIILIFWIFLDIWLIKDTPEQAGFDPFDTCDASSDEPEREFTMLELLGKVFASPLMLTIAAIGLTSGLFRNGITQWYFIFAHDTGQPGTQFFEKNWGLLLCIFGIAGGFMGGWISDKFFQSRRGPPAGLLCAIVLVMILLMSIFLFSSPLIVGWAGVFIVMAVVGVTSLMAGTAAPDFGGRKATATCSGIVDGFTYLGSSIQSLSIGYLVHQHGWQWWPNFLMPFAAVGLGLSVIIWKELPTATKRYISQVESKGETFGEKAPPHPAPKD